MDPATPLGLLVGNAAHCSVEERDHHPRGEHDALEPAAHQKDHRGGEPVQGEEPEVTGPRGQPEQTAEDEEQQEERGDTPEADCVGAAGVLEALAGQLALERIRGRLSLLHAPSISWDAGRLALLRRGMFLYTPR